MRKLCLAFFLFAFFLPQAKTQSYKPPAENLKARSALQDRKFGMFIHWGASSVLGAGEWVMNNRNIKVDDYNRLLHLFNPQQFDAEAWVNTARKAGMKYIVFVTRHHDGFSNWDTKFSDWKITNTPYGKDVLKLLADECKKQNMPLGLYYSTLDWYRSDYPHETGRTGKGTGRQGAGNYASYLQFMKNQLTELLTSYGDIMSIWFDGHWDQTNPEGHADRGSRIDWKYEQIYSLIHTLQPGCLIGNNHHLAPLPGEDFQMFEKDLPGQNKAGLSFQPPSDQLPLETCETMNDSWGFNITDTRYKSVPELIHYLVNAAGRNTNFLLNIGPMPNGVVQQEFLDTLQAIGNWLTVHGKSVYGTRGHLFPPQEWGVLTARDKTVFAHILKHPGNHYLFLPGFNQKIKDCRLLHSASSLNFRQQQEGTFIYLKNIAWDGIDTILEITME